MKSLSLLGLSLLLLLLQVSNGFSPFSLRLSKGDLTKFQNRNKTNKRKGKSALGASISADDSINHGRQGSAAAATNKKTAGSRRVGLTMALCYVYLSTVFTMTLIPVILMPVVATTRAAAAVGTSGGSPAAVAAAASGIVAAIASVSTLGGAVGRFMNGFVIQILGGKPSSASYLVVLASLVAVFGSLNPVHTPQAAYSTVLAGMEFCYSIQWAAVLYILSNHYLKGDNTSRFTKSVTSVSLASTVGILGAKAVGPSLLQWFSPRMVAYLGSLMALSGALVMNRLVQEYPDATTIIKQPFDVQTNIIGPLKAVGGSKLFWLASIGHGITYLARQADRILGSFFQEVSGLPTSLCAGLTASVTLGFVHGLVTATKKWPTLKTPQEQNRFFIRRYTGAVLSCLGLALTSVPALMNALGLPPAIKASLVALVSGGLASSIAYQFYQFPPLIANLYGKNKAVVTSWFNGMGFFIAAPVWAMTSRIVKSQTTAGPAAKTLGGLPLPGGWALAWSLIGLLFGVAGMLQTQLVLPKVLKKQG